MGMQVNLEEQKYASLYTWLPRSINRRSYSFVKENSGKDEKRREVNVLRSESNVLSHSNVGNANHLVNNEDNNNRLGQRNNQQIFNDSLVMLNSASNFQEMQSASRKFAQATIIAFAEKDEYIHALKEERKKLLEQVRSLDNKDNKISEEMEKQKENGSKVNEKLEEIEADYCVQAIMAMNQFFKKIFCCEKK